MARTVPPPVAVNPPNRAPGTSGVGLERGTNAAWETEAIKENAPKKAAALNVVVMAFGLFIFCSV